MSTSDWEKKKVLEAPGAAVRVAEARAELRNAVEKVAVPIVDLEKVLEALEVYSDAQVSAVGREAIDLVRGALGLPPRG